MLLTVVSEADIDLRTGLRDALTLTEQAVVRQGLRLRAARPPLRLAIRSRAPAARCLRAADLAALDWGAARALTRRIPVDLHTQAREPAPLPAVTAAYKPNHLLRARVLDDFGAGPDARSQYARALMQGPRRRVATRPLYLSGMIHGALWRPVVVASLNALCALPVRWRWTHRQRLPYLPETFRRIVACEHSSARCQGLARSRRS